MKFHHISSAGRVDVGLVGFAWRTHRTTAVAPIDEVLHSQFGPGYRRAVVYQYTCAATAYIRVKARVYIIAVQRSSDGDICTGSIQAENIVDRIQYLCIHGNSVSARCIIGMSDVIVVTGIGGCVVSPMDVISGIDICGGGWDTAVS